MKPFVKLCIALSGILFILGLIGIGIGISMGATPEQLLSAGHFPSSLFRGHRTHLSVTPESDGILPEMAEDFSEAVEELNDAAGELQDAIPDELPELSGSNYTGGEEYYEFRDIDSLDMDFGLCELRLFQHTDEHIAVVADNTRNCFTCRQEGSRLILVDKRPSSTKSNSMDHALRLDLYLPEQEFKDISLELGCGSIELIRLSADTVDLDSGVGNISIGTLSCRSLEADTGVGEFTADSISASREADISLGTGSAVLTRYEGAALDLDCGLGNVTVNAAGRETDYDYCLEAAFGGISINHKQHDPLEDHHDFHHEDGSRLDVQHDAAQKIQIVCAFGTAELNFTEE